MRRPLDLPDGERGGGSIADRKPDGFLHGEATCTIVGNRHPGQSIGDVARPWDVANVEIERLKAQYPALDSGRRSRRGRVDGLEWLVVGH